MSAEIFKAISIAGFMIFLRFYDIFKLSYSHAPVHYFELDW